MRIKLPTEAQSSVISRGKSSTTTRISKALQIDNDKSETLLTTITFSGPPIARASHLLNMSVDHQFLVPISSEDNKLTAYIISDVQLDPSDGSFVLCNLSDTIGQVSPYRFPLSLLTNGFTTLVDEKTATDLKLSCLDDAADTFNAPNDGENQVQLTMELLHWPDQTKAPLIALLPLIIPILPGMSLPESFDMKTFKIPVTLEYACLRAWQKGIVWSHEFNGQFAATQGGPLFRAGSFPQDTTFSGIEKIASMLIDSTIFVPVTALTNKKAYDAVVESTSGLSNGLYYFLGSSMPAPKESGPRVITEDDIKVTVVTPPKATKTEEEQLKHSESVSHKYALSFAMVDFETKTVTHPTISPEFKDILSATNKTAALKTIQDHVAIISEQKSNEDTRMSAYVSIESKHITSGLLSCIRNFEWFSGYPSAEMEDFKTTASPANFLPLNKGSVSYTNVCVDEVNALFRKEYVTRGSKDAVRGGMYHGKLHSIKDVISMVANTNAFLCHFIPDYTKSLCHKMVMEYVDILTCYQSQRFWEVYDTNEDPAIRLNVVQDVCQIYGEFHRLGNQPSLVNKVSKQEDVGAITYERAKLAANRNTTNLLDAINNCRPGLYGDLPKTLSGYMDCCHPCSAGSPPPPSVAKRGGPAKEQPKGSTKEEPKPKPTKKQKAKEDPTHSKELSPEEVKRLEQDKEKGLFTWESDGSRKIPKFPPIRVKGKPLCIFYMTRGFSCNYGDKCTRCHIFKMDQLDAQAQKDLIEYIAKPTTDLKWAAGKAPTPSTE
jgi:hypothetical protein